jgi:hypothetical protein
MFLFVVKYFGFIKKIPLLTFVFDSFLRIITVVRNPKLNNAIDKVENEIFAWPGVTVKMHKFGGIEFRFKEKELGHIHGNGLTDILFSNEISQTLKKQFPVEEHHTIKNSGWISYHIRSEKDAGILIELFRKKYDLLRGVF